MFETSADGVVAGRAGGFDLVVAVDHGGQANALRSRGADRGGVGRRRDPRAIARRVTPRRTRLFEVTFPGSRGRERATPATPAAGELTARPDRARSGVRALHERQALDVLEWKSALPGELLCLLHVTHSSTSSSVTFGSSASAIQIGP